jgi:hypothetical protein
MSSICCRDHVLGEGSLRRALRHYEAHYHEERNHRGKDNILLFPLPTQAVRREQEKVQFMRGAAGTTRILTIRLSFCSPPRLASVPRK